MHGENLKLGKILLGEILYRRVIKNNLNLRLFYVNGWKEIYYLGV